MGNKLSSKSNRKDVLTLKLEQAKKTGVLNLSDANLTPTSSIWSKIDVTPIKLIDLSGNALPNLPVEIFAMSNLRKLKCSNCRLENLYSAMSSVSNLVQLDADHNKLGLGLIGELPTSITQLNLAFNELSSFPTSILPLDKLLILNISGNRIESLAGISHLVNLSDLHIDDNVIGEIPEEVSKLEKLKKLSLKRNRIGPKALTFEGQSIHERVLVESNLESIDLEGNPIKKSDIMNFNGIEWFLERRKKQKEKNLMLGASTDLELFGM